MYFVDWTLKILLNNNPGIVQLFQHWIDHYKATTTGTALKQQRKTPMLQQ